MIPHMENILIFGVDRRTERVHEIWEKETEDGDKFCSYDDFETMSGPLAFLTKFFVGGEPSQYLSEIFLVISLCLLTRVGRLIERFSQWNRELGEYVEAQMSKT